MPNNDKQALSGQEWYAHITSTYHVPLKASTFVPYIRDGHGNADHLACHVMEWILDWYRPTKDGLPRYHNGRVDFPSSKLAEEEFCVNEKKLKRVRATLGDLDLVTFHSQRHSCWVEVNWEAVEGIAKAFAERRSKLKSKNDSRQPNNGPSNMTRQPNNGPSNMTRQPNNGPSNGLDGPTMGHKPPIPSSALKSSSFEEVKEEDVENSVNEATSNSPASAPAKAGPTDFSSMPEASHQANETDDGALRRKADELIEYGINRGRGCDGKWAESSRDAFISVVLAGNDLEFISKAWKAYIDAVAARNGGSARKASDLGHWLHGVDLNDRKTDYGELSFDVLYEKVAKEAQAAEEKARVEAGGIPTPSFKHVNYGNGQDGWMVYWVGHEPVDYDAVPTDATPDECRAAWPEWWESNKGQFQNTR